MANEDNMNIGYGKIAGITVAVTLGIAAGKCLWNGIEKHAVPFIGKKISKGVEYLKDVKRKKTEEVLKTDEKSE